MMTTIEKYLTQFESYFNGNLDQESKLAFEKLIKQNHDINTAWTEYCSVMEACSDTEVISLRSLLEKSYKEQYTDYQSNFIVKNYWFRLAAAAITIIILGSAGYLIFMMGGENFSQNEMVSFDVRSSSKYFADTNHMLGQKNKKIESGTPSRHVVENISEYASIFDQEEYQISPVFAELIHNVYRSNWFRIINPEDSMIFRDSDNINYCWETNIDEPIYFDLLDRNGNIIFKEPEPVISPWTFRPNLSPAIYMYRFATKDQPIWMGVICIVK